MIPALAQECSISSDIGRIWKEIEEILGDCEIVIMVDGVVDRTAELA